MSAFEAWLLVDLYVAHLKLVSVQDELIQRNWELIAARNELLALKVNCGGTSASE